MKNIYRQPINRALLSMLMVSTLFEAAAAKADVVSDWNTIAVNTAVVNQQNPFAQARYAAIVQLAVFEAVNSITREYKPYLGTITAPPGASAEAAGIEAAYNAHAIYFPASASALLAARTNSLAQIPDGQSKVDGIAIGDAAATLWSLSGFTTGRRHRNLRSLARAPRVNGRLRQVVQL